MDSAKDNADAGRCNDSGASGPFGFGDFGSVKHGYAFGAVSDSVFFNHARERAEESCEWVNEEEVQGCRKESVGLDIGMEVGVEFMEGNEYACRERGD